MDKKEEEKILAKIQSELSNKANRKPSTSIQYQLSNRVLFDNIFCNWKEFDNLLHQGPNTMKNYLYEQWNNIKEKMKKSNDIEIQDLDKVVTINDFDVSYNRTSSGINIFYFTFPDYNYRDPVAKYVALALTEGMPRYFTLEYSEHVINREPCWVIGEWVIREGRKVHLNWGTTDNMRLSWFAGYVMGILEKKSE